MLIICCCCCLIRPTVKRELICSKDKTPFIFQIIFAFAKRSSQRRAIETAATLIARLELVMLGQPKNVDWEGSLRDRRGCMDWSLGRWSVCVQSAAVDNRPNSGVVLRSDSVPLQPTKKNTHWRPKSFEPALAADVSVPSLSYLANFITVNANSTELGKLYKANTK